MRVALIGTGQIARQHLACLKTLPGVTIAGVCDRSRGLAECAAERFGVPAWFTDHRAMLAELRPDVVHVTTPPASHYELALDAIEEGAHVLVEKPATTELGKLEVLAQRATARARRLIENQNYVFNESTVEIVRRVRRGEFGAVTHVEAFLCLDIFGSGSSYADPNLLHPCLALPGGAIADFLTHLASLCYVFVGAHRNVHTLWGNPSSDALRAPEEFRALVDAERGTALLGFSARAQPDAFWLSVYGERMQAVADLFETRLTFRRLRGGAKPLRPLRDGLAESLGLAQSSADTLWRKLRGRPASYAGLWHLIRQSYRSLDRGDEPPITLEQVIAVNQLVEALKPPEQTA